MKKVLILCLALTLIICNFASCGNPSEESSAVSSSSEISETSEEPKIPENVLYYEGEFLSPGDDNFPIWLFRYSEDYEKCRVFARFGNDKCGIIEYFRNNDVPDDTYFWVAIEPHEGGYYSKERDAVLREYLSNYDFIEAADYQFAKDLLEYRIKNIEYTKLEISGNLTHQEYKQLDKDMRALMVEYLSKLIPNVNTENKDNLPNSCSLANYGGYVMGYVSAKALREMSWSEDKYKIKITWMPKPDNYDLLHYYLTGKELKTDEETS